jgi:hypothetical protein
MPTNQDVPKLRLLWNKTTSRYEGTMTRQFTTLREPESYTLVVNLVLRKGLSLSAVVVHFPN